MKLRIVERGGIFRIQYREWFGWMDCFIETSNNIEDARKIANKYLLESKETIYKL